MFDTALQEKRAVGVVLLSILLSLLLLFNCIPKLDTVRVYLAAATSLSRHLRYDAPDF